MDADVDNYTFRLKHGDDLFESLEEFVSEEKVEAGCMLSGVGSVTRAVLRLANRGVRPSCQNHFFNAARS